MENGESTIVNGAAATETHATNNAATSLLSRRRKGLSTIFLAYD